MDAERESYLEEYYRLQLLMNDAENSVLVGRPVSLPVYGEGIITFQSKTETRVKFDNEERSFDARKVGEFYLSASPNALQKDIERIERLLEQNKSPTELMQGLVNNWGSWDKYENYYLNVVAPDLIKTTKWGGSDAPYLRPLKEMLSSEDWNRLPIYIADIHFGRKPEFIHDQTEAIKEKIKETVEQKYIEPQYKETVRIINRIIQIEIAEEKKKKLTNQLFNILSSDFFSAASFYRESGVSAYFSKEEFEQLRLQYASAWFRSHSAEDQIIPDNEQLKAICADNKNIELVARAGSGKTATIVNRYRFLTEYCHADSPTMLLLAFNRKAAAELRSKISSLFPSQQEKDDLMPQAMTVHSLAYTIVHPQEDLLYDDEEKGNQALTSAVQSIIDEKLRDIKWAPKIRNVMLSHFKGNWEAIEAAGNNLSKEQQLLYLRSLPHETLNREYVKSYGEKCIANILFEHDVEYYYEKAFYWSDGSPYRPDFTVNGPKKSQVIIEYFGLAGDPDYDMQIERKKLYWSRRNIPLISVFPNAVADPEFLTSKLLELLQKHGIEFRQLTEDEIWEKAKKRALDEFSGAVKSFIGRCRKKALSADNLKELIQNYNTELVTEREFLEIASNIYEEYLKKLENEHLEDFDGLIIRAISDVEAGKSHFGPPDKRADLKAVTHIMIDEYQDFSYLFDKFLNTIRLQCPDADIFCVGDDWQAINGFAGSDVYYFQEFLNRYSDSGRYSLNTNYRSRKEIITTSTNLMSTGASDNEIKAAKAETGNVRIAYLDSFVPSQAEKHDHSSDLLTPAVLRLVSSILNRGKKVVLLTRTNERIPFSPIYHTEASGSLQDKFLASIQSFFTPDKRNDISISTTHKYKGKEEDAVIILDAMQSYYPLIHPTWIFQQIFGDTLEKLIEEEKRLFYVAVSRAKEELYILSSKTEQSPFIPGLGRIQTLDWNDYPALKTDTENIRLEIKNQPRFYEFNPTVKIKEEIKAANYKWDASRKAWFKYLPKEDFNITDILNESWAKIADHVLLLQYDPDDQIEHAFLMLDGQALEVEL